MSKFVNDLNPIQQNAVTHTQGPVLVVAGPGSGKTRVLTYRIAHIIEFGVKPWEILALTFTNKAANEMKDRIQKSSRRQCLCSLGRYFPFHFCKDFENWLSLQGLYI